MIDAQYIPWLIAVAGAIASWACHRWGREHGYNAGFEAGHAAGLLAGAGVVSPSVVGGRVRLRECQREPGPDLSGGPRERA